MMVVVVYQESFAYLDTYKPLHEYNLSDKSECWEAYYLRNCYWGKLFMEKGMPGTADYVQRYHEKHPEEAVKIGFLPASIWSVFEYTKEYDFAYGERFYDLSWNHGFTQRNITIASLALAIGIGFTSATENGLWSAMPAIIQDIFASNCVAVVFVLAIVLSFVLPKDMDIKKISG